MAKFCLVFLFITFLQSNLALAANNISITSWQENTYLNSKGKVSEVLARGRIKNLAENQAINAFTIGFSKDRLLKISDVICDGKDAQYSFNNNLLNIKFNKSKTDGQEFLIYFAFDEKYPRVDKYLRQEFIDIPPFAAGADSKVTLNFPGYLESATLNPNIAKQGNTFVYSNKVPPEGVRELIKLTPAQSIWSVNIKAKITALKGLKNAEISLPDYFKHSGQKVENINFSYSTTPTKQKNTSLGKSLEFNTPNNSILIETKARISTGKNNRLTINRNPNDYLEVSRENLALLGPTVERIKIDPRYKNLPLYAKIGKFVHDFIRYDSSYVGRLSPVADILRNQAGVCTEYALLYNNLARIAKIPAINIEGAACGEYDKCVGHAWNMIYVDGKWIEVDPTWDLMSGIVSSSHVYFNDTNKGGVIVKYFDDKYSVNSVMDFEMKESD